MPPRSPSSLLLFLDWDGTLTTHSTLPLIASITTQSSTSPYPSPSDIPNTTTPRHHHHHHHHPHPLLTPLSQAYARSLAAHAATYAPAPPQRTTVAQELAYLDALRPTERASIERVEASGIFRRVTARDVDLAAVAAVRDGAVRLRAGVWSMLGGVQGVGGRVAVVSVAWSGRFVRGVLGAACKGYGGQGEEGEGAGVRVGDVQVRANEIEGGGEGRLDRVFGAEEGGIWTAGDKERVMDDVVAEAAAGGDCPSSLRGALKTPRTVYIGDSPTDLACLLKADVGICIRDAAMSAEQRELQGTLERVGVRCLHVGGFERGREGGEEEEEAGAGKGLWWARDFEEVCGSGVFGEMT